MREMKESQWNKTLWPHCNLWYLSAMSASLLLLCSHRSQCWASICTRQGEFYGILDISLPNRLTNKFSLLLGETLGE